MLNNIDMQNIQCGLDATGTCAGCNDTTKPAPVTKGDQCKSYYYACESDNNFIGPVIPSKCICPI